jgi:hypothetical protein
MVPLLIEAVESYVTLVEICRSMRGVWGSSARLGCCRALMRALRLKLSAHSIACIFCHCDTDTASFEAFSQETDPPQSTLVRVCPIRTPL